MFLTYVFSKKLAIEYNVPHIAEGGEYEALTFKFKQMYNRSTTVHFSTTPPLLAICCYVPFFFINQIKMETKIVYRIENPEDKDGMWYTKDGILRKKIHILCPDGIAKDFPMPFNPIHKKDGHIWQSAGKNVENMNQWFTASDAINLFNNGFKLFEFETTMYQELEMEVLFCRKGIIKQREIPLESIWDISSVLGRS